MILPIHKDTLVIISIYITVVILCSENDQDRRNILLRAVNAGLMDGSYVFFLPDHLPAPNVKTPWVTGGEDDDIAKKAYAHVFQVS